MKKILSLLIISLTIFFGIQVYAAPTIEEMEEMFSGSQKIGVDCFDYYKFQSVQVNVGPNKNTFNAGEDVDFSGKIGNENRYPIFNGYLYVRIAEKNPAYIHEGHNIVDEFIALGPISVDASSSAPVSFSWKIPENLKTGEYTANYFFSVNKKMNLGGLPFTNEIIVGFADFSIASTKTGNVSFIKSSTKVNEAKYNHIGNWPLISPEGKAVVSQTIQNSLKQDIKTEISYNLYYWDSLDPKDLISTKKESLTLKAGESKTLTYEISRVELSAYYLQIVAKNENGTKSIVNMRITSDVARPRINYFGLDSFPIQKGATATLYSCFHNTSNISASGTTVLIAKDKMGNEISKVEYTGIIPSAISAQKTEFIANSKLDYIKLEQKIYDDQKNLLDAQEIIYDVSLIKEPEIKAEPVNSVVAYVLLGLIVFGLLLFFVRPIRKNKNLCLVISLVIISLAGALLVLFMQARPVKAQSTLENFSVSQSSTLEKAFSVGFIGNAYNKIFNGFVNYNYNIITSAKTSSLKMGDSISFTSSSVGSFNGTGGGWDSPYLGEKLSYKAGGLKMTTSLDAAKWVPYRESTMVKLGICRGVNKGKFEEESTTDCIGGSYDENGIPNPTYIGTDPYPGDFRYGYRKQSDIPELNEVVSSNESVIKCTLNTCKAVGGGTAVVTTRIRPSEVILGYQHPFALRLFSPDYKGYADSILFEGFSASWEFEVSDNSDDTRPRQNTCKENVFTYGDWGECVNSIQTRPYATTTECVDATNGPVNIKSCCVPEYTYTWSACDVGVEESVGVPTLSKDCFEKSESIPPQKTRPCPGYTSISKISTCTASQGTSTKISLNKQMQWKVEIPSSIGSGYIIKDTKWSGTNILATTTNNTNVINKMYTTVGVKNINATTTVKNDNTTYIISCSSSTNVILGDNGINEI